MESTANIQNVIYETINSMLSNLFSSIDNSIYLILDEITFLNDSFINDSYLEKILGTNFSNGILLICNSLIIAFLLYYAISLIFSYISFSNIQRPFQFLFRLIVFTLLMNFSYFFCEQILNIVSLISLAIREIGENLFGKNICFAELITLIDTNFNSDLQLNIFSFNGLLKSFISISFLNLVFSYSLRYALIKVFILISPFAFLSLISEKTNWFFKTWLRSFISFLSLQILVSIILLLSFAIDISSDNLFLKIIFIGNIYSLIKANSFIKELIGGISTDISTNFANYKSLLGRM